MPPARIFTAVAVCAITASASATIEDLTNWQFYYDNDPGPGPLQDATASPAPSANLAQLNFLDDVDVPAGYDIGFSSINANTVAQATSGYYFSAAEDFSVSLDFSITLASPNGLVALGFGIGEDRKGVNSAGIGLGLPTLGITIPQFQGASTNNDNANFKSLDNSVVPSGTAPTYSGTLNVAYDVDPNTSEFIITVGATGTSNSTTSFTSTGDLTAWAGDDLLVSFFLRSDTAVTLVGGFPVTVDPWTGTSAQANFSNLTVSGTATQVPEPTSLALLALGGLAMMRRRREEHA